MNRFERWWRTARPKWWNGPPPATPTPTPRIERKPLGISQSAAARFAARPGGEAVSPFVLPEYPPGVLPGKSNRLAMDDATGGPIAAAYSWATGGHGLWAEGIGFMGYPYLAELTQRPEYRHPSEIMAEEMTRKWIKIKATGDDDKSERVKRLEDATERFRLRETFRDALELDGFFGRSQIYIDTGASDNPAELLAPLLIDKAKIRPGGLRGFKVVDPTWTAPNRYNSSDPLDATFYRPTTWFVMGKEVHHTRLLLILGRPVPDLLKPAYNFGGISLSQMMKPYVDNWLRARQSVSDLMQAFTVFVLETDLSSLLGEGSGEAELARLAVFAQTRNNHGLLEINKETEALSNISAPLGTLDALQAQAQEHMAAVARVPLVKLFGITPSGLNASSDGEIRTFYDTIRGRQQRVCGEAVRIALDVLQLNEFGDIDPEITFEFEELWQLDEAGKAAVRKTNADTDAVLSEVGAIGPDDIRKRVAGEIDSPYAGLDGEAPGVPDETDELAGLGDPAAHIAGAGASGAMTGANSGV